MDYNYTSILNKFYHSSIPGKLSYKIDNNTYAFLDDFKSKIIRIHLHDTDISLLSAGKIVLNADSWLTFTTKDRFNHILHDNNTFLTIYQNNHIWYISSYLTGFKDRYKYQNNLTLEYPGNDNTSWRVLNYAVDNTAELMQLKGKIARYTAAYYKLFAAGKIGPPDNGDCMFCRFNLPGEDHLKSHIDEKYYVSSLMLNAFKAGNTSMFAHDLMVSWITADKESFQTMIKIVGYQLKKILYKYMINQLLSTG